MPKTGYREILSQAYRESTLDSKTENFLIMCSGSRITICRSGAPLGTVFREQEEYSSVTNCSLYAVLGTFNRKQIYLSL